MILPTKPNAFGFPIFSFNRNEANWILFIGSTECPDCHSEVYLSKDFGDHWQLVNTWVTNCQFSSFSRSLSLFKDSIHCLEYKDKKRWPGQEYPNQKAVLDLRMSSDLGQQWNTVLESTNDFQFTSQYLIASSVRVLFALTFLIVIAS